MAFIGCIVFALGGLGVLGVLDRLGFAAMEHPAVSVLVLVLMLAVPLELGLEGLRRAGRHEDRWWRP